VNFLIAVILTSIGPSLPRLAEYFDLNYADLGLLFTFEAIGFTAFTFLSGIIADHIGKKRTMMLFLIMLTVSVFLWAFSLNYSFLNIMILVMGGGIGIVETMSNALLSDLSEEGEKTYQINIMQCFFGLGAIAGPILIGLVYSYGVSWRSVYLFLGFAFAAATVWFFINRFPPLPTAEKINLGDMKTLLADRKFLLICLSMLIYTGSEVGSWGWMAEFTESVMYFSVVESGAAVAVFWTAMTVTRLILARELHRINMRKLIMGLSVSAGVMSALMGAADSKAFVWAVIALLGVACSGIWANVLAYGAENYKKYSGTVFATLIASGGVGNTLVPGLMGLSGERFGLRWSLSIPAVLFCMIAVLFVIIPRLKSPAAETVETRLK